MPVSIQLFQSVLRMMGRPVDRRQTAYLNLVLTASSSSTPVPQYDYDLVLLDDFIPRLDGSRAIRIARQEGFVGVVVMLTGNMQKNLDDCSANDVMHKPLRFPDRSGCHAHWKYAKES